MLRPLAPDPWDTVSLHKDPPDSLAWTMTSIWFAGGALYHSENRGTSVRSKEEEERKLYYMKYKTFWWKTGSLFNRYAITMCVAQFHLTRNRIPPGLLSWEFTPSTDSPAQYRQLLSLCSCRPVSSEPSICCCSARLTAISSVILIWARSLAGQHSSLGPEDTHGSHWTNTGLNTDFQVQTFTGFAVHCALGFQLC